MARTRYRPKLRLTPQPAKRGTTTGNRDPQKKILIVTEDEKSAPYYLREIRDSFKLTATQVKVSGESGSDPMSVYKHGVKLYEASRKADDPFDALFFVFDRDTHSQYGEALATIDTYSKKRNAPKTVKAITSLPCFEYWFLLHSPHHSRTNPHQASFHATSTKSVCDVAISRLKRVDAATFGRYNKGTKGLTAKLGHTRRRQAQKDAEKVIQQHGGRKGALRKVLCQHHPVDAIHTWSPHTLIHDLLQYMKRVQRRFRKQS
ncbi:MAG: RloB domain-containing protein [Magnetococcales bacterium]|nr:RloB domain-containing protein [Magnetococcales bacterium]